MKIENMIPNIYFRESRDFAYVAHVFELVFNYSKTCADNVNVTLSDRNISSNLIELYADTLGFYPKHRYNDTDLYYILTSFSYIIKNKGNFESLRLALQLMFNSQKIEISNIGELIVRNPDDKYDLIINVPEDFKDIILLEDLFDYILPTGFTYRFESLKDDLPELTTKIFAKTYVEDHDNMSSTSIINSISDRRASHIKIKEIPEELITYDDIDLDDENLTYGKNNYDAAYLGQINTTLILKDSDSESSASETN